MATTKRNMAAETAKAIKTGAALTGVQDNAVANFTLDSLLTLFKASLSKLATLESPTNAQRLFVSVKNGVFEWFYIDPTATGGSGGVGAAEFSTINGQPSDNNALALVLAKLATKDALAALIDDVATTGTSKTHSITTIRSLIATAVSQAKNDILGGVGPQHDTLLELQQLLDSGASQTSALLLALAVRLRFDAAQVLTDAQKAQAIQNLGLTSRLLPANPSNKPFLGWVNGGPVWVDAPTGTGTVPNDNSAEEALDVAAVTALGAAASATQTLLQRMRTSNGL